MIAPPTPAVHVSAAVLGRRPRRSAVAAKSIGSSPGATACGRPTCDQRGGARGRASEHSPPMRRSSAFRYDPSACSTKLLADGHVARGADRTLVGGRAIGADRVHAIAVRGHVRGMRVSMTLTTPPTADEPNSNADGPRSTSTRSASSGSMIDRMIDRWCWTRRSIRCRRSARARARPGTRAASGARRWGRTRSPTRRAAAPASRRSSGEGRASTPRPSPPTSPATRRSRSDAPARSRSHHWASLRASREEQHRSGRPPAQRRQEQEGWRR